MKKDSKPKKAGFDERFDEGEEGIDFSKAIHTEGLSKIVKLPPMTIPAWLAADAPRGPRAEDAERRDPGCADSMTAPRPVGRW